MSASDKKFFVLLINCLAAFFLLGAAVRALALFLKARPALRAGDKVKIAAAPAPAPVNKKREGATPANGVPQA
jgi:hypothetical protein